MEVEVKAKEPESKKHERRKICNDRKINWKQERRTEGWKEGWKEENARRKNKRRKEEMREVRLAQKKGGRKR